VHNLNKEISEKCRLIGCDVRENAPMAEYTTFHIGGPAELLVTTDDPVRAQKVRKLCEAEDIPLLVMGNGSNLLVCDEGVKGVVLRLDGGFALPEIRDGLVVCKAGIPLKTLCRFARDNGLSGLEFAYGIPGTVGGAVYMNAGAYDGQISGVLEWAEAMTPNGEICRFESDGLRMVYRHSVFMEIGGLVISAAFRLRPDDPEEIGRRMDEFMRSRREKQPLEYPSAGSFFRRPEGHFAGALIEKSGLKGCRVGEAQVSEKHAGFIINLGGATCSDVRRLAEMVRERVYKDHGVLLQPEVCYIG
jgi:UDP-N-acetylmuramate dehydrogenase